MAVSYTGVMKGINNLTKPMQEKVLKKLGLSTKDLPGRTSKEAGITVGKQRVKVEKKIDQLIGGGKTLVGVGAVAAAYSASDFINDLLGIKKTGDGTLRADERKTKPKATERTYERYRKEPKPVPKGLREGIAKDKNKVTPKVEDTKKQLMMKEKYSGKDSNVKFNAKGGMMKKYSKGGMTKKGKK
jgi:hypothetical protein